MDLHPRREGGCFGLDQGILASVFLCILCGLQVSRKSWKRETRRQWSREGAARAGDGDMLGASADEGEGEVT
jgi:hypothetical protein